jgi:hypothetical protein
MLRYRALLVDTEKSYKRPVQGLFNDIETVRNWAVAVLTGASATASVVIYELRETEIGCIEKSELDLVKHDQSAVSEVQQAAGSSGKS